MPREISGLRIARSYITPTDSEVSRVIDFQLGARQGISIEGVIGSIVPDTIGLTLSTALVTEYTGVHSLHLESGSLETVPFAAAQDEDTIDSEVFYRQDLWIGGNDDVTTEFRASLAINTQPQGLITFNRPIFAARNITHRGISNNAQLDLLCHVIIYYVFVEFSLAELGLILARRT